MRPGWWWTMVALGAAACSGSPNSDATGDDDDDGCSTVLVSHYPEDGATDVFQRSVVDAMIAVEEPDATITVTDASGAEVPGTVTHDIGYVRFEPDEPFAPGETYKAELSWSCPTETWSFTVSDEVGAPVTADLTNRTYALDLTTGRFAAPINIGPLFETQLTVKLLLNVDEVQAGGLSFSAGSAVELGDDQDLCSPTTVFDELADFSADPFWSVEQPALQIMVLGDLINATELELSGQFVPDGSRIEHASIRAWLDTRDMLQTITGNPNSDPEDACNLISAGYGVQCVPCPSDGGEYCFRLVEDNLTMPLLAYTLEPRTMAQIGEDPVCTAE